MNQRLLFSFIATSQLLFLSAPPLPIAVDANGLPYETYTYSSSREQLVQTQDAYLPLSMTLDLGGYTLDQPQDITLDAEDRLYIADTGHSRVLVYDMEADETIVITDPLLDQPMGVTVDALGRVYVADFGSKKAFQFTYDEDLATYAISATYQKPVPSPYFADEDPFDPTKVIVDKGMNVYLLLAGNINGLAQYKNDGEFYGFFGGNRIPNTIENTIRSILFDEQQRREWFQMVPKPVYNVAVDQTGLVLTSTKAASGYLKLNIANVVYNESAWGFDTVEDLAVGPYNNVFTVTSEGYLVEYDPNGSVLFIFSGPDTLGQKGLFKSPTGVAVDSHNNLYVVDETSNALQIFVPTLFADLVHEAIDLYFDGRYAEALVPWQQVLRMNRLFDLANQGLGDAYFALGNYEQALDYYRIARDREGFSNAYWEVRNDFLLNSGAFLVWGLLVLVLVTILQSFLPIWSWAAPAVTWIKGKWQSVTLLRELSYPLYLIGHPSDGYYGIKREGKFSNLSGFIYLGVFFMFYLMWMYETNFLFNAYLPSDINVLEQAITIFVPFAFWVVANFLVSSIRDGEGKLSDVFQASAVSLWPMIIALPILTVISQGLTYNESFIYEIGLSIAVITTAIYFVLMVKEIHFYEGKDTVANIAISIFTALMMMAMLLILYFLLGEVWTLISDILQEVGARV